MARIGISYRDVAEAATELLGQGRNPTVEQIRILLGTGSSTTIANHLRQWKANQESTALMTAKENIPNELTTIMKGLWERVLNHSQEQVDTIESAFQQTQTELCQEIEKYKTNNRRWQKLFTRWQQEKSHLSNEKLTLEQALEFSHKENASLHAKVDGLFQQLQEKQERIDELKRFYEQERESAREQRLQDKQQFDQEKQALHSKAKKLNEELGLVRDKVDTLQQKNNSLTQSYSTLEKKFIETESLLQKTVIENKQASHDWQKQNNELQTILNEKISQLNNLSIENKVVSQQLVNANQSIVILEEQNKLLTNDKWALGQQKAQLEGQLKQMQQMEV